MIIYVFNSFLSAIVSFSLAVALNAVFHVIEARKAIMIKLLKNQMLQFLDLNAQVRPFWDGKIPIWAVGK